MVSDTESVWIRVETWHQALPGARVPIPGLGRWPDKTTAGLTQEQAGQTSATPSRCGCHSFRAGVGHEERRKQVQLERSWDEKGTKVVKKRRGEEGGRGGG